MIDQQQQEEEMTTTEEVCCAVCGLVPPPELFFEKQHEIFHFLPCVCASLLPTEVGEVASSQPMRSPTMFLPWGYWAGICLLLLCRGCRLEEAASGE